MRRIRRFGDGAGCRMASGLAMAVGHGGRSLPLLQVSAKH
jgi:hypothetical protein